MSTLTRRGILGSAGVTVLFTFATRGDGALAQGGAGSSAEVRGGPVVAPDLPGSLSRFPNLDAWIHLNSQGQVTVFTGKAELGQGVKTALRQLAIDELDVAEDVVELITADTSLSPNEGYTAGSHSISDSGAAIATAAANVRHLLLAEAAQRWSLPVEALSTHLGAVTADGRSISYGELATGMDLRVRASPDVARKPIAQRRLIGRNVPRVDIPDKLLGRSAFIHDLRLPRMLHGRVVRGPCDGTRLDRPDLAAIARLPGITKVVVAGGFTAVLAETQWPLVQAMRTVNAMAWVSDGATRPVDHIYDDLKRLPAKTEVILDRRGPGTRPTRHLSADYTRPYLMHGSIGPSCALALLRDGQLTVWTHTQGVGFLRDAIAELVGMDKGHVRCIHVAGSGCYGHNGADDVAADAALAAISVPGRPVRMLWMREQEHGWEPLGPAMTTHAEADLDANGRIVNWAYQVWSNPHTTRPLRAGDLLAGRESKPSFPRSIPKEIPQPEGDGDRNAIPIYAFPAAKVVSSYVEVMPQRVSSLRGLGSQMNVFAIESFMDELAVAAGQDPVAFRLAHLDDPRAQAVVTRAADEFGWRSYRRQPRRAAGFAFSRYKNLAAYCAVAIDMEIDEGSGRVIAHRIVAAVDSGDAVNPDGIRNQIEGGILQTISWTGHEEVRYDLAHRASYDWSEYPILRFADVPRQVQVHVIDRPGTPMLGSGEASQGPASAAYANAIYAVTGKRLRSLPLTFDRIAGATLTEG